MAFYGSYHVNSVNKLIHFFCVPLLLWTVLVWCTFLSEMPSHVLSPNSGLLVIAVYSFYYFSFDLLVSFSWLVCLGMPLWISASVFRVSVGRAWLWALAMHIWGWYMQLHVGHGIFEKQKPAFMDSFFQSVMLAPLFVWYELLFALGFCLELKRRVEASIASLPREKCL